MSGIALDPLIAEAKERARRRRRYLLAVLAIALAVALTYNLLPSGGSGEPGRASGGSAARVRAVATTGSSGGVTWVMNGRGVWLTADGGQAWQRVALPRGSGIDQQYSHVQFVDPQRGWISININESTPYHPQRGERWAFARTTDGGRTWEPSVASNCHGRCTGISMDFLDARRGYLLAHDPGVETPKLLRTADGGRTWQPVAKLPFWGSITFLNDRVGFAFANSWPSFYWGPPIGTLYRTTDGGRTWSTYHIGGSKSLVEEPIRIGHRIVVVQNGPSPDGGVNLGPGTIYLSADGRHWTGTPVPGTPTLTSWFTAVSPRVWAFSTGDDLHTTQDAGGHWRKVSAPPRPTNRFWPSSQKINFTSSQAGWALLSHRLYQTTDGGLHWAVAGPRRPKAKPIPVHACDPAQLKVAFWFSTSRMDQVGHIGVANVGKLRCRLSGWPTVVAVKADGSTVRAKRISPRFRLARPIVIWPGRGARAQVLGVDLRPGHRSVCPRVVRLRVTPPVGHTATTLAGPWGASAGRNFYFPLCGAMSVTPLRS